MHQAGFRARTRRLAGQTAVFIKKRAEVAHESVDYEQRFLALGSGV